MDKDIKRLEEITSLLEKPETNYQDAVKLFREGVVIVKANYDALKMAEGEITELKKELDSFKEVKFDQE